VGPQFPQSSLALNCAPPNKRLKLTGPALSGIVRLCARVLSVQCTAPCARQPSPRSLSAVR
jgi:hypothetical protein